MHLDMCKILLDVLLCEPPQPAESTPICIQMHFATNIYVSVTSYEHFRADLVWTQDWGVWEIASRPLWQGVKSFLCANT